MYRVFVYGTLRVGENLTRLDELEDYPRLYTRRCITTSLGNAWLYLWAGARDPGWPAIDSGDWPRYRQKRDQRENLT